MASRGPGSPEGGPGRRRAERRSRALPLLALLILALALAACSGTRHSLLVITVDTLRRDHLGAYGESRDLSPELDALALESVVFDLAYAPTPFTRPSVAAMLTGRYPEPTGVVSNRHRLPAGTETLAGRLRAHGFRTSAVVSNYVLRASSGLDQGFESYDARLPQRERVRGLPERTARATTDAALRELERFGAEPERPFFLWVHYQDPHGPYTPPEGLRGRYRGPGAERPDDPPRLDVDDGNRGLGAIPRYQYLEGEHEPAFYRAGYAGEVRHVDAQTGRLLAALDRKGLRDRTVVVFAADHGEGLGARDYWFAHGEFLTDALVRIPLFVDVPGLEPGRRGDTASLLDLMPTALARLDVPAPEGLPGRDLLAESAASAASIVHLATLTGSSVPRRGLVAEGWKYVLTAAPEASEHMRRISAAEAGARASAPERRLRMRSRVMERWKALAPSTRRPPPVLSEEERHALEALGYLPERTTEGSAGPARGNAPSEPEPREEPDPPAP